MCRQAIARSAINVLTLLKQLLTHFIGSSSLQVQEWRDISDRCYGNCGKIVGHETVIFCLHVVYAYGTHVGLYTSRRVKLPDHNECYFLLEKIIDCRCVARALGLRSNRSSGLKPPEPSENVARWWLQWKWKVFKWLATFYGGDWKRGNGKCANKSQGWKMRKKLLNALSNVEFGVNPTRLYICRTFNTMRVALLEVFKTFYWSEVDKLNTKTRFMTYASKVGSNHISWPPKKSHVEKWVNWPPHPVLPRSMTVSLNQQTCYKPQQPQMSYCCILNSAAAMHMLRF